MSGHETVHIVVDIVLHSDPDSDANDISLLKVDPPFVFNDFVQPIPIASKGTVFKDGMLCTITGWGTERQFDPRLPEVLKWAQVPVVNQETCRRDYRRSTIYDSNICAGDDEHDSCQGDSGGPMVCDGLLAGIVSWGLGCARKGFPGVYTRVSYFEDFIKSHAV